MPQLDRFIFFSQFFWVVLFFFIFYFFLVFYLFPSILGVLMFRKKGVSLFLDSRFKLNRPAVVEEEMGFFYSKLGALVNSFFNCLTLGFLSSFEFKPSFFFRRYSFKFGVRAFYLANCSDRPVYHLCNYFFYKFVFRLFQSNLDFSNRFFLVFNLKYYLSHCFYYFYGSFFFKFLNFYYRNFPNIVHVDKMAFDWLFRLLRRLNSFRLIKLAYERRLFYINSLILYINHSFEFPESLVPISYENRIFYSKLAVDLKSYVPMYLYVYDYFSYKGILQSVFIWRRFFNGRAELVEKE